MLTDLSAIEPSSLQVLPYGFVPDWFLSDTEEDTEEMDDKIKAKYELSHRVSGMVLQHLVAYMKANDIVFATAKPA